MRVILTTRSLSIAGDIDPAWLSSAEAVGVTAGASAPEVLVENVITRLRDWGAETGDEDPGSPETVVFALPKDLLGAIGGRTTETGRSN